MSTTRPRNRGNGEVAALLVLVLVVVVGLAIIAGGRKGHTPADARTETPKSTESVPSPPKATHAPTVATATSPLKADEPDDTGTPILELQDRTQQVDQHDDQTTQLSDVINGMDQIIRSSEKIKRDLLNVQLRQRADASDDEPSSASQPGAQ